MWPLFDWAYRSPSLLVVYDTDGSFHTELQSQRGVRQGDPPSSVLYDVAVQSLYENVGKRAREAGSYTAVAVHDDYTGVGTPDRVRCVRRHQRVPQREHRQQRPRAKRSQVQSAVAARARSAAARHREVRNVASTSCVAPWSCSGRVSACWRTTTCSGW